MRYCCIGMPFTWSWLCLLPLYFLQFPSGGHFLPVVFLLRSAFLKRFPSLVLPFLAIHVLTSSSELGKGNWYI